MMVAVAVVAVAMSPLPQGGAEVAPREVEEVMAGQLCRCTGYRWAGWEHRHVHLPPPDTPPGPYWTPPRSWLAAARRVSAGGGSVHLAFILSISS